MVSWCVEMPLLALCCASVATVVIYLLFTVYRSGEETDGSNYRVS